MTGRQLTRRLRFIILVQPFSRPCLLWTWSNRHLKFDYSRSSSSSCIKNSELAVIIISGKKNFLVNSLVCAYIIITDKGSNFCGIFTIFQREIYDWNYMNQYILHRYEEICFSFVFLKLGLLIVGVVCFQFYSLFLFLKFSSLLSGLRISKVHQKKDLQRKVIFKKKDKENC